MCLRMSKKLKKNNLQLNPRTTCVLKTSVKSAEKNLLQVLNKTVWYNIPILWKKLYRTNFKAFQNQNLGELSYCDLKSIKQELDIQPTATENAF